MSTGSAIDSGSSGAVLPQAGLERPLILFTIALAAVLSIFGVVEGRQFQVEHSDIWEHAAVIRALTADLADPGNPHLATDEVSPRYMPYWVGAGVLGRALGLDPIAVLKLFGVANILLLLSGGYFFFRNYFKERRAGIWGVFVLLFGWGISWYWGNVHSLHNLALASVWPASFVFALSLAYYAYVIAVLDRGRIKLHDTVLLCGIAWICWLSHSLTGAITLAGALALVAFRGRISLVARAALAASVLLALPLAELWPYFAPSELITTTLGDSGQKESLSVIPMGDSQPVLHTERIDVLFYNPFLVAIALWPLLFAIPAVFALARYPRHWFIAGGAIGCLGVYALNQFVDIPLGHRFLPLGAFFLQCALVALVIDSKDLVVAGSARAREALRHWRQAAIAALIFATVINFAVTSMIVFQGRQSIFGLQFNQLNETMVGAYQRISATLPSDAIVLATEVDSWPLPAFAGKVVVLHHYNPLVPSHAARLWDVEVFFASQTAPADRDMILSAYDVTHLLLRESELDARLRSFVRDRFQEVYRDGDLVLYAQIAQGISE